jgi:hypothetical protein
MHSALQIRPLFLKKKRKGQKPDPRSINPSSGHVEEDLE